MNHSKIVGLAVMAALVLLAFVGAGAASATELCKANETPCAAANKYGIGTKIHLVSESGHVVFSAAFAKPSCASTVEGEVTNGGGAGTVIIKITTLTFTGCTEPCTLTQKPTKNAEGNFGTLEIHTQNATSNGNGTVTWFNVAISLNCSGVECEFGSNPGQVNDLGTLTGGNPATFDVNALVTYLSGAGQFVCSGFGDTASSIGAYQVTKPTTLWVI